MCGIRESSARFTGRRGRLNRAAIKSAVFGLAVNFLLFLLKLYIGISSNSLSIYCDAVNNLGDTFSCIIGLSGFYFVVKLDEKRGKRVQSLASFVIGAVVAVTGAYFAYSGLERLMYPTPVAYSKKYAVLIFITIFIKLIMGFVYLRAYKKTRSPVIKTLTFDSFTDAVITLAAFLGFTLAESIEFAIDGAVSVIMGIAVAVAALRTVAAQAKYLVND